MTILLKLNYNIVRIYVDAEYWRADGLGTLLLIVTFAIPLILTFLYGNYLGYYLILGRKWLKSLTENEADEGRHIRKLLSQRCTKRSKRCKRFYRGVMMRTVVTLGGIVSDVCYFVSVPMFNTIFYFSFMIFITLPILFIVLYSLNVARTQPLRNLRKKKTVYS